MNLNPAAGIAGFPNTYSSAGCKKNDRAEDKKKRNLGAGTRDH
jgi:hypothetical protein